MKIEGCRVVRSETAHPLVMQTLIADFSAEAEEIQEGIFGIDLAAMPKRPPAFAGGPETISCKLTLILDRDASAIKLERLEIGVDVHGESPAAQADDAAIGHWLPMKKAGFRQYEIDEDSLPESYPRNAIVDGLKKAMYKMAR
jgi:hypothetical protein